MRDKRLISFWEESLRHIRTVLINTENPSRQSEVRDTYEGILLDYDKQARTLSAELEHIAPRGLLEKDMLYLIRERWMRLDDLLD